MVQQRPRSIDEVERGWVSEQLEFLVLKDA